MFTRFAELPTELRLRIWNILQGEPRELELRFHKEKRAGGWSKRYTRAITSPTVPITTQICKESREEALQLYQPRFRTAHSDNYIYTSWKQDLVSLQDIDLAHVDLEDLVEIRHVRLYVHDVAYFTHFHTQYILQMEKLGVLELMLDDSDAEVAEVDHYARWWPRMILADFDMISYENPGRVWPRISIRGKVAGNSLATRDGGALIPGWKEGDPHPDQLVNNMNV